MVNQINAWIESGCPYQEGVDIYDRFGSDNFLKTLFKRQDNGFNRQKLAEAIDQLLQANSAPREDQYQRIEFVNGTVTELPKVKVSPTLSGRSLDQVYFETDFAGDDPRQVIALKQVSNGTPEILKVTKQIELNYAEIRGLHPYLKITPPGERLHDIAVRIVQLGKKNAELWAHKNRLLEDPEYDHQEEPEPEEPVMIDLNLLNRRELIRKSLNKAANRLKKQGKPNPKTKRLMDKREQELREIDQEIARAKEKGSAND